jgi:hypothetical protein
MPQIIEYIDAIARDKNRGVLYVQFGPEDGGVKLFEYDYHKDTVRAEFLQWLDQQGIAWKKCGPFVTGDFCFGYLGDIYIDIPYDEGNEQYQLVRDRIENPDGTMRDEEKLRWYFLPLEYAMKNAHQDEPGYWDRVGENL